MPESLIARILTDVRCDIEKARAKRSNLMNAGQFEKNGAPDYVVRSNIVHAIAKSYRGRIRNLDKKSVLDACESLFEGMPREANVVACDWAIWQRRAYVQGDFPRFERWLKKYARGWGLCDAICCGPLGYLLHDFPELAPKVRRWAKSKNLWHRRAAAVSLIPSVRDGLQFELALEISDFLLPDNEDYVQKGYGWLLKEASKRFQQEVLEFVMARRDRMPRTALRYAIEKMPQELRQKAIQRV